MKKIFYVFVISFLTVHAHAQLAGSKWNTTFQLDQRIDVVFNFTADTLEVSSAIDNSSIETMKYFIKDTVLSLQKLYGQSGCDTASAGTYSYAINGNELWIKLITDDCPDRSNVIKDIKLTKAQ